MSFSGEKGEDEDKGGVEAVELSEVEVAVTPARTPGKDGVKTAALSAAVAALATPAPESDAKDGATSVKEAPTKPAEEDSPSAGAVGHHAAVTPVARVMAGTTTGYTPPVHDGLPSPLERFDTLPLGRVVSGGHRAGVVARRGRALPGRNEAVRLEEALKNVMG